ncbi:YbaB/EbfC family nucleoid-associated protein [Desulfovibrio ferrophilus]|uniref:Nucleoid-associated protein DFE_1167 n=1 Tax=Desulfovibrio ferrophilus TaxID=241368 RepID=A0A2Z6AXG9_9BACT|nr:YbaB/EbfC family nucleoid-associated protein [Desulfovibrio ferrophilus]BBD07893.1 nucleoid-associated protein dsx2_0951 [Desulfovibrio ferrophilus]
MRGMNDMVRQAQMMQKKMQKLQEEMEDKVVEASSGGGMVTVEATCSGVVKSVKIDPSVIDPEDVDMLQDLVLAAVNEAVKKGKDFAESEMKGLTGGINIPGIF